VLAQHGIDPAPQLSELRIEGLPVQAELEASSQDAARIERETQAEPQAGRQPETSYEMEP
jgi:hypothetical protein